MKKQLIILLITVFISRYNTYSQESVSVDKWKEYIEELIEKDGKIIVTKQAGLYICNR